VQENSILIFFEGLSQFSLEANVTIDITRRSPEMLRRSVYLLIILVLSLSAASVVLADAPSVGTVHEGTSVPGITLGDTRAEVESAYGPPQSCSSVEAPSDFAFCKFDVEGGGSVWTRYRGPDGGNASNSPDDVVRNIRWYDVDGWITTADINTTLALADPQAVIDAYPDAEVTYNAFGSIYQVRDPEIGIEVTWNHDFYGGFTTVSMSIFGPYTPPPPPDMVHVDDIEMTTGRRSVTASVLVLDDQDRPVEGAVVDATWTYPNGASRLVNATTSSDGYATFKIDKARRGLYYLSINDVTLEGYVYDYIHSLTISGISKTK